jgi:hypothetical protein
MNTFSDGTPISIIFDSGNDTRTYITTKLLKKLNYLKSDGSPQDTLIANNTILDNFQVSSKGVNDVVPVIIKSKLCKLYFKFTSPKLNNDIEYTINAFIKDSTTYDILFGQDTMKKLFDDGYSIKYKLAKSSFTIPNTYITAIHRILSAPININNSVQLKNVYLLLKTYSIDYIDTSLLTNQKINDIIITSQTFFNGQSNFNKKFILFNLDLNNDSDLTNFYDLFKFPIANRLSFSQIMS